jgi:hypothetical protein
MPANPSQSPPKPGRNHKGQFTKGNPGGPGNPFARQVAELRKALLSAVTPALLRAVADELIAQALGGKLEAIKLLFQYVLGQPTEMPDPDRVDIEEWKLAQERAVPAGEVAALFESMAPPVAIAMVETMQEAGAREMQQMMAAEAPTEAAREHSAANGQWRPTHGVPQAATRQASLDVLRGRFSSNAEQSARVRANDRLRSPGRRLHAANGCVPERPSRRKSPAASGDERRADGKRATVRPRPARSGDAPACTSARFPPRTRPRATPFPC